MITSKLDYETEIVLANGVSSIAFPALPTDGANGWADAGPADDDVDATVFIESSQAMTLSGGLGIYGYRNNSKVWYLLGSLNGGTAIATLGGATGFATMVPFCGAFNRLALGPLTAAAVTPSAGTVTARICKMRQFE